jgi:ATP-dependent protease ClpP protease subunit
MKSVATVIVAVIGAGIVATSGLIDINIHHKVHLPDEISRNNIVSSQSFFNPAATSFHSTKYDIHLKAEIKGLNEIRPILEVLDAAKAGDVVVFHIAGFGGEAQSMYNLINHVRSTKAKTVMIVEAPCYSAHAYLAVSGDVLIMRQLSYLMFHTISIYGTNCSLTKGMDRNVSNVEHCQNFLKNALELNDELLDSITILTEDEKELIKTGHDVYITDEKFNQRTAQLRGTDE